ncbi:glycoprotein hormone beta-5 isoform X3 [Perca fluviatilis]|uniref:glycoprotein hormone beta-5 isoform X3 n=1 Tax=Perca fluviatilis TaxID=8168 RepID=UPI001962CCBD|nr:glycoprotein hormone beta-5 isoform X3 [Perca fluviatilis]
MKTQCCVASLLLSGPGLALCCFLLWISLQPDSLHRVSAVNLRRFIGCAVREFTFLARKPGCGGLHITTDACWGRCETWEMTLVHKQESIPGRSVCLESLSVSRHHCHHHLHMSQHHTGNQPVAQSWMGVF